MPPPAAVVPDPALHPVLLFDGVCNLCHGTVRFVLERDRDARFRFAPLDSPTGRAFTTRFGIEPGAVDSVVLIDARGAHVRSDAMLGVARLLGAPWSWAAPLGWLPRAWRDAGYDFIARRRYRWFGRVDACPAPAPEWRERFLD